MLKELDRGLFELMVGVSFVWRGYSSADVGLKDDRTIAGLLW